MNQMVVFQEVTYSASAFIHYIPPPLSDYACLSHQETCCKNNRGLYILYVLYIDWGPSLC
uniref:Uncharacterized protein n=1 Tax=Rhizophora mucronata TaxID=61149 RepID=A0A2P2PN82_RHIMU